MFSTRTLLCDYYEAQSQAVCLDLNIVQGHPCPRKHVDYSIQVGLYESDAAARGINGSMGRPLSVTEASHCEHLSVPLSIYSLQRSSTYQVFPACLCLRFLHLPKPNKQVFNILLLFFEHADKAQSVCNQCVSSAVCRVQFEVCRNDVLRFY